MSWMQFKWGLPREGSRAGVRCARGGPVTLCLAFLLYGICLCTARDFPLLSSEPSGGLLYTNLRVRDVPWSIHIVRVDRSNGLYEIHSVHAGGIALGLDT